MVLPISSNSSIFLGEYWGVLDAACHRTMVVVRVFIFSDSGPSQDYTDNFHEEDCRIRFRSRVFLTSSKLGPFHWRFLSLSHLRWFVLQEDQRSARIGSLRNGSWAQMNTPMENGSVCLRLLCTGLRRYQNYSYVLIVVHAMQTHTLWCSCIQALGHFMYLRIYLPLHFIQKSYLHVGIEFIVATLHAMIDSHVPFCVCWYALCKLVQMTLHCNWLVHHIPIVLFVLIDSHLFYRHMRIKS